MLKIKSEKNTKNPNFQLKTKGIDRKFFVVPKRIINLEILMNKNQNLKVKLNS